MAFQSQAQSLLHYAAISIPFALAGYSFGFSQNAVPCLYDVSATISIPAFAQMYRLGAIANVPGQIFVTLATAYLTWVSPANSPQRTAWGVAAAAMTLVSAWTPTVMLGNINRLKEIGGSKAEMEKSDANLEHRQRLQRWVKQNMVRTACYLVAGFAGLKALN
ncbi:hypothetical protein K470DRAFT_219583 [Piedraia hortae CBS 480.64]|uniref:DUF1772-domain-containing protein n=1 Tax=Piedraia hortae CBS 480.64 TaxID=1314780 RepID=A0A6A7BX40_9PEZI|nr:hypothetical protein K470DRAFT_219583 [Piedraia hortae CBS 480.64]